LSPVVTVTPLYLHAPNLTARQLAYLFFPHYTATAEIYTLSLHDALPIFSAVKPDAVDIKPGTSAEIGFVVTEDKTAHAMGNRGVHVFATPYVIGLLEDAAGAVMRPHYPPGGGSVGTMVEMKHLAATPVGMKVR